MVKLDMMLICKLLLSFSLCQSSALARRQGDKASSGLTTHAPVSQPRLLFPHSSQPAQWEIALHYDTNEDQ